MPNNDCEEGRLKAQGAATELYQLAALMLGDDSHAAEVVEAAVAKTEIDPCANAEASFEAARIHLVETAVFRLSQSQPGAFDAPTLPVDTPAGCIEGDDLSSAGISADQLAGMVSGAGRRILRGWLNKLSAAQRIIFVQRAILGWDNAAAAAFFAKIAPGNWQPRQVSELFRQALCSLASSLAHSATVQA